MVMNWWDKTVKLLAGLAGAIAGLYGGWGPTLSVLCVAMALDFLSGWTVAIAGKSKKTEGGHLDSNVSWKGLLRKGVILGVVLLASMFDPLLGNGHAVRDAVAWFYIATEGLSLMENAALLGVPFPGALKKILEQAKEKDVETKTGQTLM